MICVLEDGSHCSTNVHRSKFWLLSGGVNSRRTARQSHFVRYHRMIGSIYDSIGVQNGSVPRSKFEDVQNGEHSALAAAETFPSFGL